jgi:hypothetical protein
MRHPTTPIRRQAWLDNAVIAGQPGWLHGDRASALRDKAQLDAQWGRAP